MPENPRLADLLESALRAGGYDGLCHDECGCRLGDLCPCGLPSTLCVAGYRVPPSDAHANWAGAGSWAIGPVKPPEVG